MSLVSRFFSSPKLAIELMIYCVIHMLLMYAHISLYLHYLDVRSQVGKMINSYGIKI